MNGPMNDNQIKAVTIIPMKANYKTRIQLCVWDRDH